MLTNSRFVAALQAGTLARLLLIVACLLSIADDRALAQQSAPKATATQTPSAPSSQAGAKKPEDAAASATSPTPADPHQAQILADTQKLLKLTQELKDEVAKSSKDTLSLAVIKKADEVEKLAKTLKEELSKSK